MFPSPCLHKQSYTPPNRISPTGVLRLGHSKYSAQPTRVSLEVAKAAILLFFTHTSGLPIHPIDRRRHKASQALWEARNSLLTQRLEGLQLALQRAGIGGGQQLCKVRGHVRLPVALGCRLRGCALHNTVRLEPGNSSVALQHVGCLPGRTGLGSHNRQE